MADFERRLGTQLFERNPSRLTESRDKLWPISSRFSPDCRSCAGNRWTNPAEILGLAVGKMHG